MIRSLLKLGSVIMMLCFISCSDDGDMPIVEMGKYESGVFVINQGKFGDGTGTISFYDRDTTVVQNIFQNENGGKALGNIAQSMYSANGRSYIAVNNAAKIEVVNSDDFISVASIEGMPQVRYVTSSIDNSSVYASSWGSDGVSGVLYEIDAETNEIINELQTGGGLEQLLVNDDFLFVTKSGGYGTDSVVYRYNTNDFEQFNEFIVGDNPVSVLYNGRDIYALCSGAFDFVDPSNNTPGGIYKLQASGFELILEIANGSNSLIASTDQNTLYYLDGEGIKKMDLSSNESSLFAAGSFYALGYDPKDKLVYAADAKDFSSNGEVVIFDESGSEMKRFSAGIIPGNFHFTD